MTALAVGEYLPDLPSLGGQCRTAQNVIPSARSYLSFPSSTVYSNALTARAQGFISVRDSATNVYNYAGDVSKLYRLVNQTWTDSTRTVGGAYTTAIDDYWEFTIWGETVIGTNFTDVPQEITLGSTNFIALPGSPPNARHIAVVREFVVLGNLTSLPQRVRWSAINDSHTWAVSASTQADYQDLAGDGGWVQRVIGGEFGVVFQERSIWRMTYVGSPVIFQFDQVDRQRGTPAPQSCVAYGNVTFYLAEDGFYFFNGTQSIPIGSNKVDKTFLADLDPAYVYRINAAIDPVNKIVAWAYPQNGSGGVCSNVLLYNWNSNKWSTVSLNLELLAKSTAQGYTLDGLDTVTTNLDSLTPSLDSRAWTGGKVNFGSFDTSHRLCTFTGNPMTATVDIGEVQHLAGRRSQVYFVRPMVEGGTASIQVGTRNLQSETPVFGMSSSQNINGLCPVRSNARYHRYRVVPDSSFDHIEGVEIDFSQEGDR